ncbi:uncharacterized protein LOC142489407 isoform X2 [Ascaphus truei]|uniref:uncharacterized protein LOC142489407 isoform X2 n=1 Tax=Ascaphus truei TaxID=8439 RepID=UPI003F5A18DE
MQGARAGRSGQAADPRPCNEVFTDLSSGKLPLDPSGVLNSELDRNEKVFQAKMTMILMKYDKPFEDDLLIDIASLTYDTPNGPKIWNGCYKNIKKKPKYKNRSKKKVHAIEDNINVCCDSYVTSGEDDSGSHPDITSNSELKSSNISNGEVNLGICNETYVFSESYNECQPENTNNSQLVEFKDHAPLVRFSDLKLGKKYVADVDIIVHLNERAIPKTLAVERTGEKYYSVKFSPMKNKHGNREDISRGYLEHKSTNASRSFASPLKVSIATQLKGFIGRHNRQLASDSTAGACKQALCFTEGEDSETDKPESVDCNDSDFSEFGDVTLADFYPNMIQFFSRLMEIQSKKWAAVNVLQYYRRNVWYANKHKTDLTRVKREIPTSRLSKSLLGPGSKKEKACCTVNYEANSHMPWRSEDTSDLNNSGIAERGQRSLCSRDPYTEPSLQVAKPNLLQVSFLSHTLPTDQTFTNKICNESGIASRPECLRKSDAWFTRSVLPCSSLLGPRESYQVGESPSKLLSAALLNQRKLENCEIKSPAQTSPNHVGLIMWPKEIQGTIRRRHSFSTFPIVKSPAKTSSELKAIFKTVYRKLVLGDPHPMFLPRRRILNAISQETQVSETVNALINSPVSSRRKRAASDDLSFSKLKRHRSIPESHMSGALQPQSYYIANRCPQWERTGMTESVFGASYNGNSSHYPNEYPALSNRTLSLSPSASGSLAQRGYSWSPRSPNTWSSPRRVQRTNTSIYRKLSYK